MSLKPESCATGTAPFSESDFEHLATAIDTIAASQRELFLAKLVILLAVDLPAGAFDDRIERARKHLKLENEETP